MEPKIILYDGTSNRTLLFSETLLVPNNCTTAFEINIDGVILQVELACRTTLVVAESQIKWEWKAKDVLAALMEAPNTQENNKKLVISHCAFVSSEPSAMSRPAYLGVFNGQALGIYLSYHLAAFTHVIHLQFMKGGNY